MKSSLSNKIPVESYEELLSTTTQHLRDAEDMEKEQARKISSHMVKLTETDHEELDM